MIHYLITCYFNITGVDAHNDPLKVAVAEAWKEARSECEHINDVLKPFDWTYTTAYKGTLLGSGNSQMKVSSTEEKIDLEKLKVREKIHFYADILLFEDELADNGTSVMNVKIRVMPSGFFILMRLFIRVDGVIVRVNDTRIYHEGGQDHMLREFTSRDEKVTDIKASLHALTDPNQILEHLSVRKCVVEKLEFPKISSPSAATDSTPALDT